MAEEDAVLMKEFRKKLDVTQAKAATILGCSRALVARTETGCNRIVWQRRRRMEHAAKVFESGGLAAVEELKPFSYVREPTTPAPVPAEDREEMKIWRMDRGFDLYESTEELGLSVHSIRAIERGRIRISKRVRANMRRGARIRKENG